MQNSLYKLFEDKCVLEVCVLGVAQYMYSSRTVTVQASRFGA